ncbi:MAG: glycerol-3-phosphate 1-O-acyltransferase PlsY [Acidimicrobiia bacterium]
MIWALALVVPAYLIGNIAFSVLVAKMAGHDIYNEGSKNPGASNVVRIAGWKWGLLAMALDIAKGFIPTLLTAVTLNELIPDQQSRIIQYLVGFATIVGHSFPIGRKGGKSIATGGGVIVALFPIPGITAIALWAIIMKFTKLPVVSSLVAAAILPIWVFIVHYYMWEFVIVLAFYAFVVIRHIPNIKRLLSKQESSVRR